MATKDREWANLIAQIKVVEAFNGFNIYDLKTGECKGMGDGVDWFCVEDENTGEIRQVRVGTMEFYREVRFMVAHDADELREAYFGD